MTTGTVDNGTVGVWGELGEEAETLLFVKALEDAGTDGTEAGPVDRGTGTLLEAGTEGTEAGPVDRGTGPLLEAADVDG